MVNFKCCLCPKKIVSSEKKHYAGQPALWPAFLLFVGDNLPLYNKKNLLCSKCHILVKHLTSIYIYFLRFYNFF
jgi:hypothetical protein